ncbi:hypothetical protein [Luteipulveratus flavus]|uniref:Uncharacterized protein n=1 Tax=Luteipulveratus flavus TaxID=3031728 RepID=A0ABT6C2V1_9MICO|nr:hypothetical protein [Luteipulveratus sp. YIM 133296]MDF8263279.1 hypothetical protein [Luteipulveratus sp. YIM 133296]
MWRLKNSRGQFDHQYSRAVDAVADRDWQIVGGRDPGANSNSRLIGRVMSSIDYSNETGTLHSRDIYCGLLASSDPLIECHKPTSRSAVIAVGDGFVRLIHSIAHVWDKFPTIYSDVSHLVGEGCKEEARRYLGSSRASAARYVLRDIDIDLFDAAAAEADAPHDADLWGEGGLQSGGVESMLLWAIAHEIAHLVDRPKSGRMVSRYSRLQEVLQSQKIDLSEAPLWNSSQTDELIADMGAMDVVAGSSDPAAEPGRVLPAALIATTALGIFGWAIDGASYSQTHPSPFYRTDMLLVHWLNWVERGSLLGELRDRGFDETHLKPLAADLSLAYVFSKWIAGNYRLGRDDLAIISDAEEVWRWIFRAQQLAFL